MSDLKPIKWNGKPIDAPGLYFDMPLRDYHRADICIGPSISSSGLRKLFNSSAAHFYDTWVGNPNRSDKDDDKAAWVLGRAVHHLTLGEPFFAQSFITRPSELPHYKTGELRDWHGNHIECKKWLVDMAALEKTVLTPGQIDDIKGMQLSLSKNILVHDADILNGLIEHSMFWQDRETGVWLKARPDVVPTSSGDYADLKSCDSVAYIDLQRSLDKWGYQQQGALILEGATALDMPAQSFVLVFVESGRPHCTRVVQLKDDDIVLGVDQNRIALRQFAECIVSGKWPGPGDSSDVMYLGLSDRARERIQSRIKFNLAEAS